MLRRKFLNLSALAAVAALAPITVNANDFRTERPDVWTATKVDEAIAAMYGSRDVVYSGVNIKMPDVATNAKAIPLNVSSDIQAKSLTVFQDANPEATLAAFTVHENSIINYDLRIKMKSNGQPVNVTAIIEGTDGKLYAGTKQLSVSLGGCDGE